MNKNEKIVGGMIATIVGVVGMNYIQVMRTERAKRKQIQLNLEADLKAIHIASGRVHERIENGSYDGKGIQAILNDFEFEQIVARNKMK